MDTQSNTLIQVCCSTSDGMRGGFISITITRLGETVRVTSEGRLSHQQALATRSWEADDALMEELAAILERVNCRDWDRLPTEPSAPISDGMSQSVTARFSDGAQRTMYLWQGSEQLQGVYQAILTTVNRHDPEHPQVIKPPVPGEWDCPKCGTKNNLNFCSGCGTPRPR